MPDPARYTRLPDDLLARTPEEGARLVALALTARAAAARARLADPADREALHDFRVAVRRLRSTLAAFAPELAGSVGKRELRRLRKAARGTNAGRDLEVQLAWLDAQRARMYSRQRPGALWLRARLAGAKRAADAGAAGAVGKKAEKALAALLRALPAYTVRARVALPGEPPRPAPRFAGVVAARLRAGAAELSAGLTAYAALRAAGDDPEAASEQAHEARLAAKRVRYLLEPVAKLADGAKPALEQLRRLQEQLGELHDLDVLAGTLARARDDAAAEAAEEGSRAGAERAPAADAPDGATAPDGAGPGGTAADAGARADLPRAEPPDAAAADAAPPDATPEAAAPDAGASPPDVRPGLVALARRATARRAALDAEIDAEWLRAGGGAGLVAALDALAAHLEAAHGAPSVEIERKYLLRALPRQLRGAEAAEIDQGWLPGERLRERVRRVRDATPAGGGAAAERYFRTVKLGSGVARVEVEEACTRELFEALWPLTRERRVRKRRYRVPAGALVWEVDEFTDRALVLAEVELPAADAAAEVPGWLAPYVVREVTDEGEYVNANLARPAEDAAGAAAADDAAAAAPPAE
jgi:CHAD domain-containing protein/CYTH domain-containing protein